MKPRRTKTKETMDFDNKSIIKKFNDEITVMNKLPKTPPRRNDGLWFFKEFMQNKENEAEINAALGTLFQLIVGDDNRCSKTRAFIDTDVIGILSKEVKDYRPFDNFKPNLTYKALKGKGLARILVASFFLEERDLNAGNFGLNSEGNVAKIDHELGLTLFLKMSNDSLLLSKENITHFPSPFFSSNLKKEIQTIRKDEEFQLESMKYFIKIASINKKVLADILDAHITSKDIKNTLFSYLSNKIDQLQTILQAIPEYAEKMLNNEWQSEIANEFEEFNNSFYSRHKNEGLV